MWTPPDNPNPSQILQGIRDDIEEGAHDRALAKHLWFHHNATSHTCVRLSFALSDWMRLAAVYAPARDAFTRARDEAELAFVRDPNFHLFHELSAMNRQLGEGARTARLFVDLSGTNRARAQRLYHVAEPYLIATGYFDACGPFLDPPRRMRLAAESYSAMSDTEKEMPEDEFQPPKQARAFYIHDAATLVGLLVLSRRAEEANKTREEALTVLDDPEFRALLDAAMIGHLPPPLLGQAGR